MTGNTVINFRRGWNTDLTVVDGPCDPGFECTFEWDSGTDVEGMDPPVYVFTKSDIPNVRNSGSRELTTTGRTSLDPHPQWLDHSPWDDEHTSSEVKDGPCLDSYEM